jgi:multiple sugar transport system permease protein
MLSITGSLLAFDQFIVLTKGGPDNSTVTIMFAVYNTAFQQFDLGKAAALSIVLLVALVILNAVQFRFLRPKEDR